MSNLLSVDWDYFFPNPMSTRPIGDDWLLYDWGQVETVFHIAALWAHRAQNFLMVGKELPMAQGYQGFWDRFRFRRGSKLYYAESHSAIVSLRLFNRFQRGGIWNFDAHHDAGYHRESAEEITAKLRAGRATCEDWVWWYFSTGVDVHTIYPAWQAEGIEPEPAVPLWRETDNLEPVAEWFSAVFVCRSGAWMPSWTDQQFREFLDSFPGQTVELQPLVERSFDLEKAKETAALLAKWRLGA